MDKKKAIAICAMIAIIIASIMIIVVLLKVKQKSDFQKTEEIKLSDIQDSETKKRLENSISSGTHGVVQSGEDYYVILSSGGVMNAEIEYKVDTFSKPDNSGEYAKLTWWYSNTPSNPSIKYKVLKVTHPEFEVEQRKFIGIPAEKTALECIVTKVDQGMYKAWCEDYGILPVIKQESLVDSEMDIDDLEDGTYSMIVHQVEGKLLVEKIEPSEFMTIKGRVVNSLGIYDTIKLKNGDEVSIKNRDTKISGEVELIINNKLELIKVIKG